MRYARVKTKENDIFYGIIKGKHIYTLDDGLFSKLNKTNTKKIPLDEVLFLAPCQPSKIVAIGKNYYDHAKELGTDVPKEPIIFLKPPTSILDPNGKIKYPKTSTRVDYEGELAIVIKKMASKVKAENAKKYILGYTILNDVTARDLQSIDTQWTRAKGFDTFCPIGPVITDEINPDNVDIKTFLNGQLVQSSNTDKFMFNIGNIIEFVTEVMTLLPGDVITTGTPAGIGPMNIGDKVVVEIEGIGRLENTVSK
jgi:2-keto-4-pentenoate hydratase/2-oxohepta-3-ene-1,7-dioic acid hydratase in catechol pathway